jgi:chromosome transmission fidelity protein 18
MTWVKQWDWCVFGKKKGKKRMREGDENFNTEDAYHRPQQKVRVDFSNCNYSFIPPSLQLLLLSGPPGLGKTTLAHVIARQAGYEVLEINARSDH